MKRIFYFNINYNCNSNCIFCYSHNTRHNEKSYHEMSLVSITSYLEQNTLTMYDRVILNGGEPLLHSHIIEILQYLKGLNCEVLIYTNGRLLNKLPINIFNNNFRIIIPWHGTEKTHNYITGVCGSYNETLNGIDYILDSSALVEVKIIVNWDMLSQKGIDSSLMALEKLPIKSLHAIHLTKVADTIISKKNGCPPVLYSDVALPNYFFFDFCASHGRLIKFFDTCVAKIPLPSNPLPVFKEKYAVYFNDWSHRWQVILQKNQIDCMNDCPHSSYCKSAVNNYTALEYNNGIWSESWE